MNKKQYNNVIENTLKHEQSEDSLSTARAIFDNMGVALPQGDMKAVYETIKTDNYMGWKSCTMQEAQEAANNGTAAIGISKGRIVVLSAKDEEQPVAQTASVMTLDENTSAYAVEGMQYYSYGYGTTNSGGGTTINYGCGGAYRQINDYQTNCLEYALLLNTDAGIGLTTTFLDPKLNSSYFIGRIISTIEYNTSFACRSIEAYDSAIDADEYRIAARVPNIRSLTGNSYYYHFIYQLSDGTWAGKDGAYPSRHFGRGNPSNSPEMWSNDAYSPEAGTIYFAVKRS